MKVIVAGDYSPHDRVTGLLGSRSFDTVFGQIRPLVSQADFSIVNFETVTSSAGARKIRKLGPHLSCPESSAEALVYAGFDCVTLANNHFYDFGDEGVRASLASLRAAGLETVGGGMNINEASRTLYRRIGDGTLAVINCCEHEFSIAGAESAGSNPLEPDAVRAAIGEARSRGAQVLVIVHGGSEYYRFPTPRMVRLYRSFVDAGADAVVNHHQHCFSGYEIYRGKPLFYGLGNFCFDWPGERGGDWNRGYMVCIDFDNTPRFELIPYVQCDALPGVVPLRPDDNAFAAALKAINAVIADPDALQERFAALARERRGIYAKALRPTLFFRRKKALKLQNFTTCESHADLMRESGIAPPSVVRP